MTGVDAMKRFPLLYYMNFAVGFAAIAAVMSLVQIILYLTGSGIGVPVWVSFCVLVCGALLVLLYVLDIWPSLRLTRKAYLDFSSGKTLELPHSEKEHDFLPETGDMLGRLDELINRENQLLFANKQAEYQALQNQINPHFLYNALEAIRGDALDQGMESLAMTAEALSSFFRYSISDTNLLSSVDSELTNIRNYFLIQKYRFGDSLDLEVHFLDDENDIRGLMIPKLTLQPIVENSVFHGIEPQVGKGTISITFDQTSAFLYISIRDTGIGMPEKELERLNGTLSMTPFKTEQAKEEEPAPGGQKHTGIALKNVAQRIKLLFGNEYGLTVFSTQGVGTNVVITLPRQESVTPDGRS